MQGLWGISFSDLFVSADPTDSWYKEVPDAKVAKRLPKEYHQELTELRQFLEKNAPLNPEDPYPYACHLDYPIGGDQSLALRVKLIDAFKGGVIYVIRIFRIQFKSLKEIGMSPRIAQKLLDPTFRGGIIAIIGRAGAGKTTTGYSFLCEYVSTIGGVAYTIECPVEGDISGPRGNGWIYQTAVPNNDRIDQAIREKFQASPNILYVGEIYSREAIREAVRAAAAGVLVVFTFHGEDLVTGITRLSDFSAGTSSEIGLADVLKIAIYLELQTHASLSKEFSRDDDGKGTGNPPRVLGTKILYLTEDDKADIGTRDNIRKGNYHLLQAVIDAQRNKLMSGHK